MEKFARIIVGYHGCAKEFSGAILLGNTPIGDWQKSQNVYDWLGEGVYFWEHSPQRAFRWARDHYGDEGTVIGAVIQLGSCFDLLDEEMTLLLTDTFELFRGAYDAGGKALPINRGKEKKLRELDCAVINDTIDRLAGGGVIYDTVRGAFLEGEPVFPGTTISAETHIQIAVRNVDCILGVFRPNLQSGDQNA